MEVGELLAKLCDLALHLEMLEGVANGHVGQADGDGAEGVGVEVCASLKDSDGGLGGERVTLLNNLASDLALFNFKVCGNGEGWSVVRSFDGRGVGLRGRHVRGRFEGVFDKGGGRGREFVGEGTGGDGRHSVAEE